MKSIKWQNKHIIEKLRPKYEVFISNIICYIRADLNSVDAENCLYEILIDLEEQYDKHIDLEEYVGGDCKSYLAAFTSKYKKKKCYKLFSIISDYLPTSIYAISFCLFLDMIFKIFKSNNKTFETMMKVNYILRPSIYLSAIIIFLIGMLCIKNITKSYVLSKANITVIISNIILFAVTFAVFGFLSYFMNKRGILNINSFTVAKSFLAVLIIVIITLIVNIICTLYQKRKDSMI